MGLLYVTDERHLGSRTSLSLGLPWLSRELPLAARHCPRVGITCTGGLRGTRIQQEQHDRW